MLRNTMRSAITGNDPISNKRTITTHVRDHVTLDLHSFLWHCADQGTWGNETKYWRAAGY